MYLVRYILCTRWSIHYIHEHSRTTPFYTHKLQSPAFPHWAHSTSSITLLKVQSTSHRLHRILGSCLGFRRNATGRCRSLRCRHVLPEVRKNRRNSLSCYRFCRHRYISSSCPQCQNIRHYTYKPHHFQSHLLDKLGNYYPLFHCRSSMCCRSL